MNPRRWISAWLLLVVGTVLLMVTVGGITRITGSGLSMVEWRPLMGALPPTSEAEWNRVFELYQRSPQFQQVNDWMTLGDFQRIFFWEYVHRLLGRLIGLITIIPWVFFALRGWFERRILVGSGVGILLGAAQGGLGWFMVRSGLVDVPEVSHFRLAAHLLLAFFIGQWFLWLFLEHARQRPRPRWVRNLPGWLWGWIAILTLQTLYGAFMAGTRAGYIFFTFPDFNGFYLPAPVLDPGNWLTHKVAIHWIHRVLAFVVLGYAWFVWQKTRDIAPRISLTIAATVTAQVLLGILTILSYMNIAVAVVHQATAFLVLSSTTLVIWAVSTSARE